MNDSPSMPSSSAATSQLANLSVVWFVPVMGWTGLALAWRAAGLHWPWAHSVSLLAACVSAAWYVFMLGAQALRWLRYPQAVRGDAQHPVKQNAFAAIPISLALLLAWAPQALSLPRAVLVPAFGVASVGLWLTTLWILSRWLRPGPSGEQPWAPLNPMLIVPIVGNVIIPLAGLPLGLHAWSWAQMSIGLFLWPLVVGLLFTRVTLSGGLPPPLQPTWFIQIAPPSVLGAVALTAQAPDVWAWLCWGFAFFVLTWLLTQWRNLKALPFNLPHWGMSFPTLAFTALTWRLTLTPDGGWLLPLAMVLLALGTALLLWLSAMSWLNRGRLLSPERA